jgi:rifampicin phosphotransferase
MQEHHPVITSPDSQPVFVCPLDSVHANLASAGGKGANLALLARAGFPVPPGFVITSNAYAALSASNQFDHAILARLEGLDPAGAAGLEEASREIRAWFAAAVLPQPLAQAFLSAYRQMGGGPVAVRSSATAEDLPEMSFAGQQDTILNVVGEEALLRSVIQCWSSLWTARAIGYRIRNQVDHRGVALAVVVQHMVESRVAGVLFTANPLSGLRSETVIDASFGLGEALVSGQVEPDHYVVDPAAGVIRSKTLGSKAVSIHGQGEGGTRSETRDRSALQALPDAQILQLANLARQVSEQYAAPQDIEWAWAEGKLYLLQSRPITSLFPIPAGLRDDRLMVFFSFAAVQGMLDPLTTLGRDSLKAIFATGAGLFGIRVNAQTQTILYEAGERLWINLTSVVTNTVGRKAIQGVIGMLEPTIGQALEEIWDDPRLKVARKGVSLPARLRLARFLIPLAANVVINLLAPQSRRTLILANGEHILAEIQAQSKKMAGQGRQLLAQRAAHLETTASRQLPRTLVLFVSAVVAGMASWNLLRLLNPHRRNPDAPENQIWSRLLLELTRGMPYNPTTGMDLALWEIARALRADSQSRAVLEQHSSTQLAEMYHAAQLPALIQDRIAGFLKVYGGRGLGEIDMGRTRWATDPTHVFEMLASFMRIVDPASAPDAIFARGAQAAQAVIAQLAAIARAGSRGWLRARLVRFFAGRARQWMGTRESPKFFAVRMMALVQDGLLRSGRELVDSGDLGQPDDLFHLTLAEILSFATDEAGDARDWRSLIAERRLAYQRETRRVQIPRLLLGDGRAFYAGLRSNGPNDISGSPVSPGSAKGRVRVVLDPGRANLQPGEILVCPGTDPSWTPLFLSAAGLIMEVGGMMTHGAVVAREYGIPAVVGVHEATHRLRTGMLIQLDGSSGQIDVLEAE